jgi:hypothetical protein
MQDVISWIGRELVRLGLVIEGKATDPVPEPLPEALKAVLYDFIGLK